MSVLRYHICYSCGNDDQHTLEGPELYEAFGTCHHCGEHTVVTVAQLIDLYQEKLDDEDFGNRRQPY